MGRLRTERSCHLKVGQTPFIEHSESSFKDFFRRATGHDHYPYQWRLASSNPFPAILNVPTGAGKTAAAVLGWLWRRRFSCPDVRAATPRRLVYCLPMRVLVEQTYSNTICWLDALGLLAAKPGDDRPAVDGGQRIATSLLMGGEDPLDWDEYPERDAILVGTQDMLLSRALNRGYGMSRYRWPIHFAMLNNDCLWVMDEVQLMGNGLATTAQLDAFRSIFGTYGPVRSLWMSATLKLEALETVDMVARVSNLRDNVLALSCDDRRDPVLVQRLRADKALQRAQTVLSKENEKKTYARDLAKEILALCRPKTLTLVVVNTVSRAQQIFQHISTILSKNDAIPPELLLIHSRFRPAERQAIGNRLLEINQNTPDPGCIVVATQAIEAGVDISAGIMVTELAPWTSLVQRFGRCNRYGEQKNSVIMWVDILSEAELSLPYKPSDLAEAKRILASCASADLSSISGVCDPTPQAVTNVLRRRDLLELFDTTPDLSGNDLDVSPYIRETADTDVLIYWRDWQGEAPPDDLPPPVRQELCAVSLRAIKVFLKDTIAYRFDGLDRKWIKVVGNDPVWPGLLLLLPRGAGGYDKVLGWTGTRADDVRVVGGLVGATCEEGMDDDPQTLARDFVTLKKHSDAVAEAMEGLLISLNGIGAIPDQDLKLAARWHDAGKGHAVFQNMLCRGLAPDDPRRKGGPWAKSGLRGRARYQVLDEKGNVVGERKHFRHELAGALALLRHGGSYLAVYLVAAHHGKVRFSIRSLPGEAVPPGNRRFARGIWEGDHLPGLDLGGGIITMPMDLRLGVIEMGEGVDGPSWLERSIGLRDHWGPFRLAWLETLLRVADWRGSGEVHV